MENKLNLCELLQVTLERMWANDPSDEFLILSWYAQAIKDLAKITWLDPEDFWTRS